MLLEGTVTNGTIVLDHPAAFREGTRVRVNVEREGITDALTDDGYDGRGRPSYEFVKAFEWKNDPQQVPGLGGSGKASETTKK